MNPYDEDEAEIEVSWPNPKDRRGPLLNAPAASNIPIHLEAGASPDTRSYTLQLHIRVLRIVRNHQKPFKSFAHTMIFLSDLQPNQGRGQRVSSRFRS